ncbi:TPA: Mor transcription activator family protein [Salmonella enterica subsp. diarizonae serovar 61:l,v:z35]
MGTTTQKDLMDGLMEAVVTVLNDCQGIPLVTACRVASIFADRMSFVWANNVIRIPKGVAYNTLKRNKALFDDFDGNNHAILGRKYGVSIQRVYSIVKEMRQAYVDSLQVDMFNDKSSASHKDVSDFIEANLSVLADIRDHCAICIREQLMLDEGRARALGEDVAMYMSNHWHGQFAYVKSGKQESDDDQGDLFSHV